MAYMSGGELLLYGGVGRMPLGVEAVYEALVSSLQARWCPASRGGQWTV